LASLIQTSFPQKEKPCEDFLTKPIESSVGQPFRVALGRIAAGKAEALPYIKDNNCTHV
jgi:hypothetical protein